MQASSIAKLSQLVSSLDFDDKEAVRNVIEILLQIVKAQAEENQKLRDENARLKGEKGKPKIPPNKETEKDRSDPNEKPKNWDKDSKNDKIKIDQEVKVEIDKKDLPPDAEFKGYREVTIQNITVKSNNVLYKLERYYSASKNKIYEADIPDELKGTQFGPELKAFIIDLYYNARVTEHKIQKILKEHGVLISEGQISNILTKEKSEEFRKEKEEIFEAGMTSDYFHTDDTGLRHNGINHHAHVFCNAIFTAFFIMRKKNNETLRQILGLKENEKLGKCLISDDAKQFFYLTMLHALCWVHEIRHYKKIDPHLEIHRGKVDDFLEDMHNFYGELKKYKEKPTNQKKKFLEKKFDALFSRRTGYWLLDKRIDLTRPKKDRLLLVLDYPNIPLHNNPAEIAIREIVIKRKISYGTRSEYGKSAWENMMSILDTCRKNSVSFFEYVKDIISGKNSMKKLAVLIKERVNFTSTY